MLEVELIMLIISTSTGYVSVGLLYHSFKKAPITEMKVMTVAFFSYVTSFLFLIPIALVNDVTMRPQIVPETVLFFRVASLFAILGIILVFYSVFMPSFKENNWLVILFLIELSFAVGAGLVNLFTADLYWADTMLRTKFDPRGLLLLTASIIFLATIMVIRVKDINDVLKSGKRSSPFVSHRNLAFIALISIVIVFNIIMIDMNPQLPIPTFTWTIFVSIMFIFLAIIIVQDPTFFFLTNVKLEAILIVSEESGLVLHSTSFNPAIEAEEILAGILTALNLSLKSSGASKTTISNVTFGDKTLVVASRSRFLTLMIVSERNIIIDSISEYLATSFEKRFSEELKSLQQQSFTSTELFQSFDDVIASVRLLIPL